MSHCNLTEIDALSELLEKKIVLTGIEGDPILDQCFALMSSVEGLDFGFVYCPPGMRAFYDVPFVEDHRLGIFYGLEGVQRFMREYSAH